MEMQNTTRAFKDRSYEAFAAVPRALANPKRLELVDLLAQRPHTVEALARAAGLTVGNTSQHLQVLKRARLVDTTRRGTSIEYRLAPGVAELFVGLRRLAEARIADIDAARRAFFAQAGAPERIGGPTLRAQLAAGRAVLLDVRPRAEYDHGHLPGARSIPLDELADRVEELPLDALIVATCRGPTCAFAADAVRILRAHGRRAVRYEGGVADWLADGGALEGAAS